MTPGWEDRHLVNAWVPQAAPSWAWGTISTWFDTRRTGHLPHAGGTLDQDARLMDAFRILDNAMGEIERGEKRAAAARNRSGVRTVRR